MKHNFLLWKQNLSMSGLCCIFHNFTTAHRVAGLQSTSCYQSGNTNISTHNWYFPDDCKLVCRLVCLDPTLSPWVLYIANGSHVNITWLVVTWLGLEFLLQPLYLPPGGHQKECRLKVIIITKYILLKRLEHSVGIKVLCCIGLNHINLINSNLFL